MNSQDNGVYLRIGLFAMIVPCGLLHVSCMVFGTHDM